MYDENDFTAVSKFLKLGIKITVKNPMGQHPSFETSFPTPKGAMVNLNEKICMTLSVSCVLCLAMIRLSKQN